MKRRILSVIMLVALLVSAIPFSAAASQTISAVEVTGLRLPEAGDPLDLSVEVEGSGYSLAEVEWYDVTTDSYQDSGAKFILGHAYKAIIWLEADSGYEFSYTNSYTPNVTATIDGEEATVTKAYGYNAWAMICVEYSFSTCPYDWIESVEVTVIPPVADTPLVHSVTAPANANYEVQMEEPSISTHYYRFYHGIQWNIEFQSGVLEGTAAQLGKWYCATVLLKPKDGYAFLENGNIKATINGMNAQITYHMSDAKLLEFSYSGFETFGRIPAFNVQIAEPVVGEYPYFHAIAEAANVVVDNKNLVWIDRTANKYMTAYDVFEAGHEYEIKIEITTATGYRFMKSFDSSYVTVNHTAANVASISANDEEIRIYKSYVMDSRTPVKQVEATSNIKSVLYDNGRYMVPKFNITAGAPAQIVSVRWQYYDPGVWLDGKWVGAEWKDLSTSAQFNNSKEYRLLAQLRIDGANGDTHYLSTPTLKVDGISWDVGGVQTSNNVTYAWVTSASMAPAEYEDATLTVTFDSRGGSSVPPIAGVHYSYSIQRPADPTRAGYTFMGWYTDIACTNKFRFAGENGANGVYENITLYAKWASNTPLSNPFTDVKEENYFYNPVLWAVEEDITKGTDATHFSPNASCTRGQAVTFLWRAAGKPAPTNTNTPFTDISKGAYYYDAILWAVEKGITNGIDATHFAPNDTCSRSQIVTFLYRYAGKPTASGNNPFADVAANAYYYDAVLWAVKAGITSGIDATHFGPNETCTRGQIVTFLYRYCNQ